MWCKTKCNLAIKKKKKKSICAHFTEERANNSHWTPLQMGAVKTNYSCKDEAQRKGELQTL